MTVSSATLYFNRFCLAEDKVTLELESASQVVDDNAIFLAEQLHNAFVKKGQKEYCQFTGSSPISAAINESQPIDKLTETIQSRLLAELDALNLPPETILVVCKYHHLANEYLLTALLGVKESVQLADSVQPMRSQYLDIANLSLAIQLDLTELAVNPDAKHAIAYIKSRIGRKVSDFMVEAFAVESKINSKEATIKLVESVESFIDSSSEDNQKQQAVREVSVSALKEAAQSGEFMNVKSLAGEIEEKTGLSGFYEHASKQEDFVEECPVYATATRKMEKFIGQGGGVSISFNKELLGDSIEFDAQNKSLTLHKLPPNLLDALQKALKSKQE
ncbi:nucleoid-associated protein [Gayadomonas joobiniege]|uniref:nucleoid-associated protein n=1 Tax=Gayadomonas joobiniege TaxID=1234606 RepID=UPI0003747C74|nr:nucleoid-associated protein [Gayadomonas joobiniege]